MNPTTIVVCEFLSAGGLAGDAAEAELMPLGVSMRDALVADLLALPAARVAGVTVADCAAAPFEALHAAVAARDPAAARRLRAVRATAGQSVLELIGAQARQHDHAWVVAPETGGLLAACQARVGAARWLGSDAAALHVASRKSRTLDRLASAGLRTSLDAAAEAAATRWVVKPDDGAGAVDTQVHTDRGAAQACAQRRRAAGEIVVLQPWVEGEALSVSLLCGPAGAELLSLNRQHLTFDASGTVAFTAVERLCTDGSDPRWPALQALADAVMRALPGLRGFVGIDLVWHAHWGPVPIEVNARVSCAYVGLSAALGRNLAGATLALHRPDAQEVGHGRG